MLSRLSIRDIVLIDRLDIDLSGGLTVLTGETGAGKSILLDAFSLALGGRGDGALVRHGQNQGQVSAVFDLGKDHPARLLASEADIENDGDLILRRVQLPDGRTKAFVNDQPVSVQVLRLIGGALVEIHGQHDDRALSDAATHRALLDSFGGLSGEVQEVSRLHNAVRSASAALTDEETKLDAARKDQEFLSHAHAELSKLGPEPNEEDDLATRRTSMQQAEKVTAELREASALLSGHGAVTPTLSAALRRLERRAAQAPQLVDPSVKALDAALLALDEAASAIDAALREADFDPADLERIEERLFALRAASRKYAVPVDQLAALAERFAVQLQSINAGEAELLRLKKALADAQSAYSAASAALSLKRKRTAAALDKAVTDELPPLKLERAAFMTEIVASEPSASGTDQVAFFVRTNPGTRPGPMMKVASGGELSRFMLALKVVLADRGSAPTLVFDEIDSGVGGAVADSIGQRLARLAGKVQVLAVTHAPQVAARAASHFLIAKESVVEGDRVVTKVAALETKARREEIARMLAGETITEEARAAADRLLAVE
jgi:DNA repair protein RecN (Recombination protein N)